MSSAHQNFDWLYFDAERCATSKSIFHNQNLSKREETIFFLIWGLGKLSWFFGSRTQLTAAVTLGNCFCRAENTSKSRQTDESDEQKAPVTEDTFSISIFWIVFLQKGSGRAPVVIDKHGKSAQTLDTNPTPNFVFFSDTGNWVYLRFRGLC